MNKEQSDLFRQNRRHRILRYTKIVLLTLVVIASTVIYIDFKSDIKDAHARIDSIQTKVYESKYGSIEYRLEGSGPTVIVLHGVTGGIDQGILLSKQFGFFNKGYRLLYISRFGYLKSEISMNTSPKHQAAAYKALLEHLGINQVFVYANSAGGISAMWFARDYPELTKGLILQSSAVPGPLIPAPPQFIFRYDFLYWAVIKAAPEMLLGILLPDEIRSTLTDEERSSLVENVLIAGLPISKRTYGVIFDNDISTPSINYFQFEQIRIPTLILQAMDDPREKKGAAVLAMRIPHCRLVGLTGGHFLLREEKKVQAEILRFFAEQTEEEKIFSY